MNDNARKWVEALRSGDFRQTRFMLGRPTGERCCLGVACDLAVKAGVIEPPVETTAPGENISDGDVPALKWGESVATLPDEVVDWLGITTDIGVFRVDAEGHVDESLAELNDHGLSFEQIAHAIEENESELFSA